MSLTPLTAASTDATQKKATTDFEVTVTTTLSESRVAYTLVAAWEGGSNYWARSVGSPYEEGENGLKLRLPVQVYALDDPSTTYELTREKLQAGLNLLASDYLHIFQDIAEENEDGASGDTLLQLSLFGKLVYG